jgi:hypothetical protein
MNQDMKPSFRSSLYPSCGWAGLAFFLGIWLKTHPYRSIWHDGVLYLGQALADLNPQAFSHDIFFAYGSQDRYSIMSVLYVEAIRLLGVAGAALALSMIGQAAFVLSAFVLLRQFLGGWLLWFGMLTVAIFPARYGGGVIWYAETFVTARTLAEPFCLLLLFCVWKSRFGWAALAGLAAMAAHPLMALPAIAVAWMHTAIERPKAWLLALSLPLIPLLGVLGVEPFTHAFQFIDPEWKSVIQADRLVFVRQWEWTNWAYFFLDWVTLVWAASYLESAPRRFLLSVAAVGVGGTLMSWVGADWLGNVLIAELQLSRAHWLLHLFSFAFAPFLLTQLYREENPCRQLASWLMAAGFVAIGYRGGAIAVLLAMILAVLGARGTELSDGLAKLVKGVCVVLVLIVVFIGHNEYTYYDLSGLYTEDWSIRLFRVFNHPVLFISLAAFLAWRARAGAKWSPAILAWLIFILGLLGWDQRSPWALALESENSRDHPFRQYMGDTDQVYWDGPSQGALAVWLLLERPSYYSVIQGAGLIFDRARAIEHKKRYDVFKRYLDKRVLCATLQTQRLGALECAASLEKLRAVCGELPRLGFIVIEQNFPGHARAEWRIQGEGADQAYYLYECASLR